MERKLRYIWWAVLVILIIGAIWKLFLPYGSKAYIEKSDLNREIVVYLTGAVAKPGLIKLAVASRLDDALKQAQPLPEADLAGINPAEKLKDGQKIVVPFKEQSQAGTATQNTGEAGADQANRSTTASTGKININTAGAAELDKLPGIGPALAERIIQYRTEYGPFSQPEDLQNVSGIGPKTYEKMSTQVTVQP
ncbi:MAG: ComEA family DNA-binding protein [Desulfitobacteriaceae bacterium]|nr:ComEA family DNA-binding protein [Desulfitobacteriaceae bacterium]MDD4345988.1 ComEA family DNA-binding protein [Desulfitobacteriaceae bacterium]MDD4400383.1 ComEA family DNA-binding protein [Desulfitobacteriaceae bacterium]